MSSEISDFVDSFSTIDVGGTYAGRNQGFVLIPNHPQGHIAGNVEFKMEVSPSWVCCHYIYTVRANAILVY